MANPRADGSRFFQRMGLAPADYLQLASASADARHRHAFDGPREAGVRRDRIADPAVRAAFLRAQLLASLSR